VARVDNPELLASVWEFYGRYLEHVDRAEAEAIYRKALALNVEAGQWRDRHPTLRPRTDRNPNPALARHHRTNLRLPAPGSRLPAPGSRLNPFGPGYAPDASSSDGAEIG
jgi:hypothetical protein